MPSRWPLYERETVEDLDVHLDNFGAPVPAAQYQVQIVAFGARPNPADGAWWQPAPPRIAGLTVGRYDAFTRWVRGDNARVVDHVGEHGYPSFEVV